MKHTIGLNYDCYSHWYIAAKKAGLAPKWHYQCNIYQQELPDKRAEEIALANFPKIPFKINTEDNVQIIAGSPPCIWLSQANPMAGLDHPAAINTILFHKTVRDLEPQIFMMEMLSQLETRGRPVLNKALKYVKKYHVGWNDYHLEEYGSPSKRHRLYILGISKSLTLGPGQPKQILQLLPKRKSLGAGPAIDDLEKKYNRLAKKPNARDIMSRWNKDGSLRRGEYSCIAKNPLNRTLSYDKPSPCITGASCDTILHYDGKEHGLPRFLGVQESSRLMGFEDDFQFNPMHRRLQSRQYSKLIASGIQITFTAKLLRHVIKGVYGN